MQEIFIGNIRGPKGDTGNGLTIKEFYSTIDELPDNPSVGDAYGVGEEGAYEIYIYSATKGWVNSGAFQPDINEQAPNYDEATTLESLTSGEKISIAFGKIKKAIKEFITHKGDTVGHITKDERTAWNGKAPGGHGLGSLADGGYDDTFKGVFNKGCGFYQVRSNEESPDRSNKWFGVLQLSRGVTENQELGTQFAFQDDAETPKMWARTASLGTVGPWVEMIHSDNIANYVSSDSCNIVYGSYTGTGTHGDGTWKNSNELRLTSYPLALIIKRDGEDFANIIVLENGLFSGKVIAGNECVGGFLSARVFEEDDYYVLKWYGTTQKWHYMVNTSTNKVSVDIAEHLDSSDTSGRARHQLNWEGSTYTYMVICE